ncbi:MAG: hypothetical protein HKP25_04895 [Marinicaulis sp.]|nr:hypothetical protein [Marinicaulis sp.]
MAPFIAKTAAAIAAVAGLAVSTDIDENNAYAGTNIAVLQQTVIDAHAATLFSRADADANGALSADEFTALSVVTAELARLNGFITIETGDEPATVAVGPAARSMTQSEYARVAAVARNKFYLFSNGDGAMTADEFQNLQKADFEAADLNKNDRLGRRELALYGQRQAKLLPDS